MLNEAASASFARNFGRIWARRFCKLLGHGSKGGGWASQSSRLRQFNRHSPSVRTLVLYLLVSLLANYRVQDSDKMYSINPNPTLNHLLTAEMLHHP